METPFALNSLPLRQRARWRVRSQVSWHKTCKASALYTIGIHAFFINLRNPIPLQMHESPPFATPNAKSCFCFPSLWQSKRKKPNFFAKNGSVWKFWSRTMNHIYSSRDKWRKCSTALVRYSGPISLLTGQKWNLQQTGIHLYGRMRDTVWDTAEDEPEYPGRFFV